MPRAGLCCRIARVIHIGFLDYSPFKGSTEFYANYQLINPKTGRIYSDKFSFRVIDLTQIENATEEDRFYQIDYWARLFKATTWEAIKMMAAANEYLSEASKALFEMNADDIARQKSLARQDYSAYRIPLKDGLLNWNRHWQTRIVP